MGATPSFTADKIPSLSGRVAIVTGASSGIGQETALQLALHGAKVYLATRSEPKTSALITQLSAQYPEVQGRLLWLELDLNSVKSAQAAAAKFVEQEQRLDLLVNNGAEAMTSFQLNDEGVGRTFAVNHLGHFALTQALLPLLTQTSKLPGADVRIVNVASVVHTSAPAGTSFETYDDFRPVGGSAKNPDGLMALAGRYGHSKLANILFTKELQRRMDEQGVPILCICLHPGSVATPGSKKFLGPLAFLANIFFLTSHQGALTSLFCATSPLLAPGKEGRDKYKAAYVVPYDQIGKESEKARDPELARRLWELSERAVGEIGEKGRI